MTNKLQAWSLLDPKPVISYCKKSDIFLVWWNGYGMTHKSALCSASTYFFRMPVTPKMKKTVFDEFNIAYSAGAFGCEDWGVEHFTAQSYHTYITSKITKHCNDKLPYDQFKNNPATVLSWFDKRNASYEEVSE